MKIEPVKTGVQLKFWPRAERQYETKGQAKKRHHDEGWGDWSTLPSIQEKKHLHKAYGGIIITTEGKDNHIVARRTGYEDGSVLKKRTEDMIIAELKHDVNHYFKEMAEQRHLWKLQQFWDLNHL